jgi:hypothetical protein
VIRGILGVAAGAVALFLVVAFLATGRVEWQLVALGLALWGAFSFFTSLFDALVSPLGRLLGGALTGDGMPATGLSIDAEVAALERLLAADPPPSRHRALMAGIRLAEIYRTSQDDPAKADALIARLASEYPDAPELKYVRPG